MTVRRNSGELNGKEWEKERSKEKEKRKNAKVEE